MDGRFVSYLRVSTGKQGLGIEAQRAAVANYLNGGNWRVTAEFIEVESGGNNDRPALKRALAKARALRCPVIVAKIDRLSRNQRFLMELVDSAGHPLLRHAADCRGRRPVHAPANERGRRA
jgi:DNA invertase Pin-like site-specific DNA recombinase